MWENAYLSIKNSKASRALKQALDPGHNLLTSLMRLHFATSATFGLRTWAPPLDQILDPHLSLTWHEPSVGTGSSLQTSIKMQKWLFSLSGCSTYLNFLTPLSMILTQRRPECNWTRCKWGLVIYYRHTSSWGCYGMSNKRLYWPPDVKFCCNTLV